MKISELKVMICDDSPLIRKKLKQTLDKLGVSEVIEAENGLLAVERYKEHSPDLVFMDIVMPEKSGLDALKEIMSVNKNAKVVMASTVGTQQNLISAVKSGAFDFLQKPIKDNDIFRIINSLLKV